MIFSPYKEMIKNGIDDHIDLLLSSELNSDDNESIDSYVSASDKNEEEVIDGTENMEEETINDEETERPSRANKGIPPHRWGIGPEPYMGMAKITLEDEPRTVSEALTGSGKELWQRAMQEEFDSLIENDSWELVPLPTGKNIVSCKWVFKKTAMKRVILFAIRPALLLAVFHKNTVKITMKFLPLLLGKLLSERFSPWPAKRK